MPLIPEQHTLCDLIYTSVRKQENIDEIVREVTKDDFLTIFTATNGESKETLLGTFEAASVGHLKAVLKFAKELGLLKEVVRAKILSSKNQDKVESISLIACITGPNKSSLDFLHAIKESCGLESFWKVISEDDRERIKTKLDSDGHKDMLDEINRIETTIAAKNQPVQTGIDYDSLSETDSDVTVVGDSVHTTEKISSTEKNLYLDLQNAIDRKEDIINLLKQVGRNDFINVFTTCGTKVKYMIKEGLNL